MTSQQRINELKRYSDHRKFFDAVLCEMSIVRQHREVFEAKAREFGNKCLEYDAACNKRINWEAVGKAIKAAKKLKDIRVRCTTPNKPPKNKWKRIDTQVEMDGLSFPWHFWGPPDFPDNPVNWFNIYNTSHYHEMGKLVEEMYGYNNAFCLPEEMLLRDYVAIACLFNKGAEERGETPILPEILSGIDIQQEYQINMYNHLWPKVKAVLIRTLETVNADLAKLQTAKTEQKELPLLLPSCRGVKDYVAQIKMPRELLDFLMEDRYKRIYEDGNFGKEPSFFNIISECAVRIREKHFSLNVPRVPIVDDIAAYKDWCIDAQKIFDESTKSEIGFASTKRNAKRAKSPPEGERSKPMSKSKMMDALNIDSYKTFNTWAKDKEMKPAGNRQTFTIRLDILDLRTRQKLEKA